MDQMSEVLRFSDRTKTKANPALSHKIFLRDNEGTILDTVWTIEGS